MMLKSIAAAAVAASFLFSATSFAATSQQKMETCKFGADDQKLKGAARKSFMTKCMSNTDAPRGKPAMPRPNPQ